MKDLLNAIKSELQSGLDYIRAGDIFVTRSGAWIPEGVKLPAVGIKDGRVTREELAGGMWQVRLGVTIFVHVQLAKDEASIMGDAAAGRKGVLDIVDDIHTALDENLLDIDGMQEAFSPSEGESEWLSDERGGVQQKAVIYEYVKEEDRA